MSLALDYLIILVKFFFLTIITLKDFFSLWFNYTLRFLLLENQRKVYNARTKDAIFLYDMICKRRYSVRVPIFYFSSRCIFLSDFPVVFHRYVLLLLQKQKTCLVPKPDAQVIRSFAVKRILLRVSCRFIGFTAAECSRNIRPVLNQKVNSFKKKKKTKQKSLTRKLFLDFVFSTL